MDPVLFPVTFFVKIFRGDLRLIIVDLFYKVHNLAFTVNGTANPTLSTIALLYRLATTARRQQVLAVYLSSSSGIGKLLAGKGPTRQGENGPQRHHQVSIADKSQMYTPSQCLCCLVAFLSSISYGKIHAGNGKGASYACKIKSC